MNVEIIKTLAANAIGLWARKHRGSCVLSVENGLVIAFDPSKAKQGYDRCLFITVFDQNAGLTSAKWHLVATELMNLYNKELACQTHQKPST